MRGVDCSWLGPQVGAECVFIVVFCEYNREYNAMHLQVPCRMIVHSGPACAATDQSTACVNCALTLTLYPRRTMRSLRRGPHPLPRGNMRSLSRGPHPLPRDNMRSLRLGPQ